MCGKGESVPGVGRAPPILCSLNYQCLNTAGRLRGSAMSHSARPRGPRRRPWPPYLSLLLSVFPSTPSYTSHQTMQPITRSETTHVVRMSSASPDGRRPSQGTAAAAPSCIRLFVPLCSVQRSSELLLPPHTSVCGVLVRFGRSSECERFLFDFCRAQFIGTKSSRCPR